VTFQVAGALYGTQFVLYNGNYQSKATRLSLKVLLLQKTLFKISQATQMSVCLAGGTLYLEIYHRL
jgi:hypothetical protein